jgi:hypothetical protein
MFISSSAVPLEQASLLALLFPVVCDEGTDLVRRSSWESRSRTDNIEYKSAHLPARNHLLAVGKHYWESWLRLTSGLLR